MEDLRKVIASTAEDPWFEMGFCLAYPLAIGQLDPLFALSTPPIRAWMVWVIGAGATARAASRTMNSPSSGSMSPPHQSVRLRRAREAAQSNLSSQFALTFDGFS